MSLSSVLRSEFKFVVAQIKKIPLMLESREAQIPRKEAKGVSIYHGFAANNFYFHDLIGRLEQEGYSVRAPTYRSWLDMNEIVDTQAKALEQIVQTSQQKESLIGHSQGGLIAVRLAQLYPELVNTVISLGAPFQGTKIARLVSFCAAGQQMLPGSDFLEQIAKTPLPANVVFYNIYSLNDHLIIPAKNALLYSDLARLKRTEAYRTEAYRTEAYDRMQVYNCPAPEEIGHSRLITLHEMMIKMLKQTPEL